MNVWLIIWLIFWLIIWCLFWNNCDYFSDSIWILFNCSKIIQWLFRLNYFDYFRMIWWLFWLNYFDYLMIIRSQLFVIIWWLLVLNYFDYLMLICWLFSDVCRMAAVVVVRCRAAAGGRAAKAGRARWWSVAGARLWCSSLSVAASLVESHRENKEIGQHGSHSWGTTWRESIYTTCMFFLR